MPVLMGLAIKHVHPTRRATAMGFYQAIYSLGMFGGPAIVGWIGDAFGLAGGFYCVSGISAIAVLCTFVLAPKPTRQTPREQAMDA